MGCTGPHTEWAHCCSAVSVFSRSFWLDQSDKTLSPFLVSTQSRATNHTKKKSNSPSSSPPTPPRTCFCRSSQPGRVAVQAERKSKVLCCLRCDVSQLPLIAPLLSTSLTTHATQRSPSHTPLIAPDPQRRPQSLQRLPKQFFRAQCAVCGGSADVQRHAGVHLTHA